MITAAACRVALLSPHRRSRVLPIDQGFQELDGVFPSVGTPVGRDGSGGTAEGDARRSYMNTYIHTYSHSLKKGMSELSLY